MSHVLTTTCHFSCLLETKILHLALCPKIGGHYKGSTSRQSYNVVVQANAINQAPVIQSQPKTQVVAGQAYTYPIQAIDPNGDALLYEILSQPSTTNLTIDFTTGLLRWDNPTIGQQPIVVGVRDAQGLGAAQSFTLNVRNNQAPTIQSQAITTATPGSPYVYDVIARDPEGDRLSYALNPEALNQGLTIDSLGRMRWTPSSATTTALPVTVSVTDAFGATTQQAFNLNVVNDTENPKVNLIASTNRTQKGTEVTFWAQATDNVAIANVQLTVGGQAVLLDGRGTGRLLLNDVGLVTAQATASDRAGNQGSSAALLIEVFDPTAAFNPNVTFDLPDVVTAPTKFNVSGEGVTGYRMEVTSVSTGMTKTLVSDRPLPANGEVIFDPSLLENDSYEVLLGVIGANGDIKVFGDTVGVEGELKLGNFRLSFTDLTIPVSGIPITVTRTYDSLTSGTTDDFGYGWRMEFRDTDLRTSLGRDLIYEAVGVRSQAFDEKTRVYITLPGGKREGFTFKPKRVTKIDGQDIVGPLAKYFYEPAFVSEKGSTSTLTVEAGYNSAYITQAADGSYADFNTYGYNPADTEKGYSGVYVLTTKDGTKYRIDAHTGDLLTVEDTNGNKLTYTDNAIVSSTGKQVTFERDAQGRIKKVIDPMGKAVVYDYDATTGDLLKVTDRDQQPTTFKYEKSDRPHYLTTILDPLNRQAVRTDYDDQGRLKQMIDAKGNPVEMVYDPNNSVQKVKDQYGNFTTYEYDDRGNILTEIDAEGKVTKRTYDDNNNALTETIVSDRSDDNLNDNITIGYTTKYTYDGQNNKTSEETGIITRYIRDNAGNVQIQEVASGIKTISVYGEKSRLLSETDALGHTTVNQYDSRGNLQSTRDTGKHLTTYGYDAQTGNLTGFTDANQKSTQFHYTASGFMDSMTDALGHSTTYKYDANGNRIEELRTVVQNGVTQTLKTISAYDNSGKLLSMTDAEGHTTTYVYDANGNQTAVTDALTHTTHYRYNEQGQLIETILPDDPSPDLSNNLRTIDLYDQGGRKRATIDQAGHVTHMVYDKVGRLVKTIYPKAGDTLAQFLAAIAPTQNLATVDWTKITYPDAVPAYLSTHPHTSTEYYSDGLTRAQIDERGNRTEYRYDSAGRMIETIYADDTPDNLTNNPKTQVKYDLAGRRTEELDPLNHKTSFQYDDLGRVTRTDFDNGTSIKTAYDVLGRKQSMTDQENRTTEYQYDDLGQLTGVKDARGNWTTYTYDAASRLTQITDAELRTTKYEYDRTGRRTASILPLTQRSTTAYDAVGNVLSTTDFNGETTTYSYDVQNRLVSKDFDDDPTVTYTYTPTGQMATVTDGQGITRYRYDERDRLISRKDPTGAYTSDNYSIEYTYDIAGNRTSVETPSGTTSYTFDDRNRLKSVIDPSQGTTTYGYDAASRLIATTLPNGVVEKRQYNTVNQLELIKNVNVDPLTQDETSLTSQAYILDKVGNRKSVTDQSGRKVDYKYDELYRLEQEKVTEGGTVSRTTDYVYDKVGNRLSQTEVVSGTTPVTTTTTYQYDSNDRLQTERVNGVVGTTYQYDNNGSTTSKTDSTGVTTYIWNDDNRLVQAQIPGKGTASYTYDTEGIRQSSTVGEVTTQYLVDKNRDYAQVLEEWQNSSLAVSYVYGSDLISQDRAGTQSFYLVDGLGSVVALADEMGSVTDTYTYHAFGTLESATGGTDNYYLFAGEQWDENLAEYYLRQRSYEPENGRFPRKDSYEGVLSNPQTLHDYIYTHNNPINLTDPTGLNAGTLRDQAEASTVLIILIKLFDALYQLHSPSSISGLRTQEQIGNFLNFYIPFFENREHVPAIPEEGELRGKSEQELDDIADDIAGKTVQNARKAAREDSGSKKSGRSGNNAGVKTNAGNGLRQVAGDLSSKHPLRERLRTRAKRYLEQARADNHKN
jgi:large repetitive protein